MSEFKQYRRKNIAELCPLSDFNLKTLSEVLAETTISVSPVDQELDSQEFALGYVARNPLNHADVWYVSKKYYDENFEPMQVPVVTADAMLTSIDAMEGNDEKLVKEWISASSKQSGVVSSFEPQPKSLGNTDADGTKKNVSDVVFFGDGDTFKLICKASSKSQGWMKSCKAMEILNVGCVIQVTTQQDSNVAEALIFVPDTKIVTQYEDDLVTVKGRAIISTRTDYDTKGNAK